MSIPDFNPVGKNCENSLCNSNVQKAKNVYIPALHQQKCDEVSFSASKKIKLPQQNFFGKVKNLFAAVGTKKESVPVIKEKTTEELVKEKAEKYGLSEDDIGYITRLTDDVHNFLKEIYDYDIPCEKLISIEEKFGVYNENLFAFDDFIYDKKFNVNSFRNAYIFSEAADNNLIEKPSSGQEFEKMCKQSNDYIDTLNENIKYIMYDARYGLSNGLSEYKPKSFPDYSPDYPSIYDFKTISKLFSDAETLKNISKYNQDPLKILKFCNEANIPIDKLISDLPENTTCNITLACLQQNQPPELKVFTSHEDKEFDTVVNIQRTYSQDGDMKLQRTEVKKPSVYTNKDGYYVCDGCRTEIKNEDCENPPLITVTKHRFKPKRTENCWAINNKNTKVPVKQFSRSLYKDGNKTVEIEYTMSNTVKNMLEIRNENRPVLKSDGTPYLNKNGEIIIQKQPSEVIYIKESDIFNGVYDITTYNPEEYDKDIDFKEALKTGTLTGGKIISQSRKNRDGSYTYEENIDKNGFNISRNYTLRKHSKSYDYEIKDKNGNQVMSLSRSMTYNPNHTITTKINDKTFITSYDDKNRMITVTDDKGNETQIDIESKMKDQTEEDKFKFYEFCYRVPADKLLLLNSFVDKIKCSHEEDVSSYNYSTKEMVIYNQNFTLAHELGHAADQIDGLALYAISSDEELENIYTEEMKSFREENTQLYQDMIAYFGFEGGSAGNGLSEFVAHAQALLTEPAEIKEYYNTSAQIIMHNFPKTMAKIADLTGYNALKETNTVPGFYIYDY